MSIDENKKLKFLIAHNGYLGQFEYFAPWLRAQGHDVVVLHRDKIIHNPPFPSVKFADPEFGTRTGVGIAIEAENAIITAMGSASAAIKLRDSGFSPDVIIAHCGWGVGLLLNGVWPDAVYIAYHEWFYRLNAVSAPETQPKITNETLLDVAHNLGRNFPIISEFLSADACWSPNEFQRSQFPEGLREKVSVFHDGVDVDLFKPDPSAKIMFDQLDLSHIENIVTYVGRGFEPTRKFPEFMRAVKLVQNRLPNVHFLIIGENRVAYGKKLAQGDSWVHIMLDELDLDMSKIHFTGFLNKDCYVKALQASSVHVYMTDPFVLSWSFFEALSSGCAVVSTDRRPVKDFVTHEQNGLLAKNDNAEDLAENIIRAISDKEMITKIRTSAREYICNNFNLDMQSKKRMDAISSLIRGRDTPKFMTS